jgi:sporulation protein YlmC with PRC-barrel domain
MSGTEEFDIGSEVTCSDGVCGDLRRVVVDPVARAITHLAVEPRHRRTGGHLVPIDFVASTGNEIRLKCTKAQFEKFEEADEAQFVPAASGQGGYEPNQMLMLPYYGLGMGGAGISMGSRARSTGPHEVKYDHVPLGEVEVRRGEHVHATDGAIGRVEGLVIDPSDHHVTHFLLQEGHLWGQKRVAIPIGSVARTGDGVRLTLTKDEVRDLPPLDVRHPE